MLASGRLAVGSGVLQLGFFVATVLVARMLGRADLGTYSVAVGIGAVVVSGAGSGLPALALRETAARRMDSPLAQRLIHVQMLATAGASLVAAAGGALIIGGTRGFVLGGVSGISNIAQAHFALTSGVRAGLGEYDSVAGAQIGCGIGTGVLSLGALVAGTGVTGCLLAPGVASLAATWWLGRGLSSRPWTVSSVDRSRLFARSVPFMGIGMVNGGYQRIDVLVVGAVAGAATAGTYASAYRVLGVFTVLARGFGTVFFSRLSSVDKIDDSWHVVRRRGTRLFALTILPLAVVAFLAMPYLVEIIFGPQFASSTTPARILLLSLVPYVLYLPNAHALNASGQESALLRVLLVATVVEVPIIAGLTDAWGASGAALAWCASECIVLLGVSHATRRIGGRKVLPPRSATDG